MKGGNSSALEKRVVSGVPMDTIARIAKVFVKTCFARLIVVFNLFRHALEGRPSEILSLEVRSKKAKRGRFGTITRV